MPSPLRLAGLPADDGLWHVDWFGHITPPGDREATVEVLLSRLRRSSLPSEGSSRLSEFLDFSKRVITFVPVGWLPFFHLGSVWRTGRRVSDPERPLCIRRSMDDIVFSPGTLRAMPVNQKNLAGDWVIPLDVLPLLPAFNTWCLAVTHAGDSYRVLIPMFEVFRFYYGRSPFVAQALLTRPLDEALIALGNPALSSESNERKHCVVYCAKEVPSETAHVMAMILFTDHGRRAAERIYPSIVEKARSGRIPSPEVYPPFMGSPSLIVDGVPFTSGGNDRFLVLRIVAGDFPLSHQKLFVVRANRSPEAGPGSKPVARLWAGATRTGTRRHAGGVVARPELQPDGSLAPILERPACGRIGRATEIEELEEREASRRSLLLRTTSNPRAVDTVSTAPAKSTPGDTARLAVGDREDLPPSTKRPGLPADITHFMEILDTLARMRQATATPVRGSASDGGSYFPSRLGGRSWPWSYLHRSPERIRKAFLVEIHESGHYYYVGEIEPRRRGAFKERFKMVLFHDAHWRRLDSPHFEEVLRACARSRGVWFKKGVPSGVDSEPLRWQTFKHSRPTVHDYAQAIDAHVRLASPKSTGDAATAEEASERR